HANTVRLHRAALDVAHRALRGDGPLTGNSLRLPPSPPGRAEQIRVLVHTAGLPTTTACVPMRLAMNHPPSPHALTPSATADRSPRQRITGDVGRGQGLRPEAGNWGDGSVLGEAVVLAVVHRAVDQRGDRRPERSLEGRLKILRRIDSDPLASEGACEDH